MQPIKSRKILPTITTISDNLWREKIEEIKKLKLKVLWLIFQHTVRGKTHQKVEKRCPTDLYQDEFTTKKSRGHSL